MQEVAAQLHGRRKILIVVKFQISVGVIRQTAWEKLTFLKGILSNLVNYGQYLLHF